MKQIVGILFAILLFAVGATSLQAENAPELKPSIEEYQAWTPRNAEELRYIENTATAIAERSRKTVVGLRIRNEAGTGWISGSGTLISSDGLIATAAHVVDKPGNDVRVYLSDGSRYNGKSLGLNHYYDCALVQITDDIDELPYSPLGHSSTLVPGQWLVSLGHPLGMMIEPLRPPVVRLSRVRRTGGARFVVDGPFAPGDSGGGTFNLKGELVGINVSIRIGDPSQNNCSPINHLRYNLERMKSGEVIGDTFSAWEAALEEKLTAGYEEASNRNWEEAKRQFKLAQAMDPQRPESYYHLACLSFREATNSPRDRDRLLAEGLAYLKESVSLGWNDLMHMLKDPDLNPVRQDQVFRSLLRQVQRRLDFSAYLGVRLNSDDLTVTKVTGRSPADRAGIVEGDVVRALNGQSVDSINSLKLQLSQRRAGDVIELTVERAGSLVEFQIRMAARGAISDELAAEKLRSGKAVLGLLGSHAHSFSNAVVEYIRNGTVVGYGPIIRSDGYLLGKFSELATEDSDEVTVRLADGTEFEGKILVRELRSDLALVKIDASELSVVSFDDGPDNIKAGQFVFNFSQDGLLSAGSLSVVHFHDLPSEQRAYLGLSGRAPPSTVLEKLGLSGGVFVQGFEDRSPAKMAGMKEGDVIVEVNGVTVDSMDDILALVLALMPDDSLSITFYRAGEKKSLAVPLVANPGRFGWGNSFSANRIRGPHNERSAGLGTVIHHDAVLLPSQMGSLLLDSDGRVLGINIARYDRSKTLAIPSRRVVQVVQAMFGALEQNESEDDEGF